MVRTNASKKAGGKAPGKSRVVRPPSMNSKKKSAKGSLSPAVKLPVPKWQGPITSFLKTSSGEDISIGKPHTITSADQSTPASSQNESVPAAISGKISINPEMKHENKEERECNFDESDLAELNDEDSFSRDTSSVDGCSSETDGSIDSSPVMSSSNLDDTMSVENYPQHIDSPKNSKDIPLIDLTSKLSSTECFSGSERKSDNEASHAKTLVNNKKRSSENNYKEKRKKKKMAEDVSDSLKMCNAIEGEADNEEADSEAYKREVDNHEEDKREAVHHVEQDVGVSEEE